MTSGEIGGDTCQFGRGIPLNATAVQALQGWATNFPERKPEHFVFPAERYGLAGDDETPHSHSLDLNKPLGSLKEAWESAKAKAEVKCRFHDMRHSACTRLVEGGVPLPVIASLLRWSAGTTVRMARRYGHITAEAQRNAVRELNRKPTAAHAETKHLPRAELQ